MAFPITVVSDTEFSGASVPLKPSYGGPYSSSATTRYLVTRFIDVQNNIDRIQVYKSTDTGQTWPTVVIGPDMNGSSGHTSCHALAANKIWILYSALGDDSTVTSVIQFDTSTDTFGTVFSATLTAEDHVPLCAIDHSGLLYAVGNLVTDATIGIPVPSYATFNGTVWSGVTELSIPAQFNVSSSLQRIGACGIKTCGLFVQVIVDTNSNLEDVDSILYQTSIGSASTQEVSGSAHVQGEGNLIRAVDMAFDSDSGTITLVLTQYPTLDPQSVYYAQAANAESVTFTLSSFSNGVQTLTSTVAQVDSDPYIFWGVEDDVNIDYSYRVGVAGSIVSLGSAVAPSFAGQDSNNLQGSTTDGGCAIAFNGASQDYWELFVSPPAVPVTPKVVGGGATYFPRVVNKSLLLASVARIYGRDYIYPRDFPPLSPYYLYPNEFDLCLTREIQLFNLIDRELLGCARKPDCFLQSERDWLDCPPGWITFNKVKPIPLPASSDGDVVIFSERVPYGYDGVITAQFHGYTENFTEGSGDIVWRVRADRRYLRDEGNITVSLGTNKTLSPVYGGLRVYSGNLIEYIVSAPNTSGLLPPPGTGNILAGLHGFFYPRT